MGEPSEVGEEDGVPIECFTYFVGHRPQATWGTALEAKNLDFLRSLDPAYFVHVVKTHQPLLDAEDGHYSSAVLRLAYGQALETLMALIAASLQSPKCIAGWMIAYKNDDLRTAIEDVLQGDRTFFLPAVRAQPLGTLAVQVFRRADCPQEKRDRVAQWFSNAWERLCCDFLDDLDTREYNSLKHGTRIGLGGFQIGVGPIVGNGRGSSDVRLLGSSRYGSRFFVATKLSGNLHHLVKSVSKNWSVENLCDAILLMATSIKNIVSFLRLLGGDENPMQCRFEFWDDETAYELPWSRSTGVSSMTGIDYKVEASDIEPWTAAQVRAKIRSRWGDDRRNHAPSA